MIASLLSVCLTTPVIFDEPRPYIIVDTATVRSKKAVVEAPKNYPSLEKKEVLQKWADDHDYEILDESDSIWLIPEDMFGAKEKAEFARLLRSLANNDLTKPLNYKNLKQEDRETLVKEFETVFGSDHPTFNALKKRGEFNFELGVMVGTTMTVGDKQIVMRSNLAQSNNPDPPKIGNLDIKQPSRNPETPQFKSYSFQDITFRYSFGFAKSPGKLRETSRLNSKLAELSVEADKEAKSAEASLCNLLLSQAGISSDLPSSGADFSKLDPKIQEKIRQEFTFNYSQYGFDSKDGAMQSLDNAKVSFSWHDFMMGFKILDENGHGQGVMIPPGTRLGY